MNYKKLSCFSVMFAFIVAAIVSSTANADLIGLWEFNNQANLGQATIGPNLIFEGDAPTYSASIADDAAFSLNGVMTTAAALTTNRIRVDHGIAANGGGSLVNQYSLVMDIFSPTDSRNSWRTLYQTNTTNSNDGDYFIRPDTDLIGVANLSYSTNPINETAWTRLVLTFDLSKPGNDVTAYINGALFYQHPTDTIVDDRFALDSFFYFFTDEDGENTPLHVGALALYSTELSSGEVAALGGPGTTIPEPGSALTLFGISVLIGFRRRRTC